MPESNDVVFLGRKQVAADALRWLNDQPGVRIRAVVTDDHLPVSATRDTADDLGLKRMGLEDLEALAGSGKLRFDLAVSMLYWRRIGKPVLERSCKGVINFHPAPLPDYKGTAGYNLAILNDHAEWGVSAHYVDEQFDTGPIIAVVTLPVDRERETALSLERKCRPYLLSLFQDVVSRALRSRAPLPAHANRGGVYVARSQMEAMKEVRLGDDVARKIRAFWFPPYDGAYFMLGGVKCTLVERTILESLADPAVGSLHMASRDHDGGQNPHSRLRPRAPGTAPGHQAVRDRSSR